MQYVNFTHMPDSGTVAPKPLWNNIINKSVKTDYCNFNKL